MHVYVHFEKKNVSLCSITQTLHNLKHFLCSYIFNIIIIFVLRQIDLMFSIYSKNCNLAVARIWQYELL